jgi:hypothetical protein
LSVIEVLQDRWLAAPPGEMNPQHASQQLQHLLSDLDG